MILVTLISLSRYFSCRASQRTFARTCSARVLEQHDLPRGRRQLDPMHPAGTPTEATIARLSRVPGGRAVDRRQGILDTLDHGDPRGVTVAEPDTALLERSEVTPSTVNGRLGAVGREEDPLNPLEAAVVGLDRRDEYRMGNTLIRLPHHRLRPPPEAPGLSRIETAVGQVPRGRRRIPGPDRKARIPSLPGYAPPRSP